MKYITWILGLVPPFLQLDAGGRCWSDAEFGKWFPDIWPLPGLELKLPKLKSRLWSAATPEESATQYFIWLKRIADANNKIHKLRGETLVSYINPQFIPWLPELSSLSYTLGSKLVTASLPLHFIAALSYALFTKCAKKFQNPSMRRCTWQLSKRWGNRGIGREKHQIDM